MSRPGRMLGGVRWGRGVGRRLTATTVAATEELRRDGIRVEDGIGARGSVMPGSLTAIVEHRAAADLGCHPGRAGGVEVNLWMTHGSGCDWHRMWWMSVRRCRHVLWQGLLREPVWPSFSPVSWTSQRGAWSCGGASLGADGWLRRPSWQDRRLRRQGQVVRDLGRGHPDTGRRGNHSGMTVQSQCHSFIMVGGLGSSF